MGICSTQADRPCPLKDMTPQMKEQVKAMEIAIAFSPDDWRQLKSSLRQDSTASCQGYIKSGSAAARNIEMLYTRSEASGVLPHLAPAVQACLGECVKHVLVCSGFYVLHSLGGVAQTEFVRGGSCETDGPLGALALVRAFASRGVNVSLYTGEYNGPVIRAGYDAMMEYFGALDPDVAAQLKRHSRCLPFETSAQATPSNPQVTRALNQHYSAVFDEPEGQIPQDYSELRYRMLRSVLELKNAVETAWGDEDPGPLDCLFACERLGAPYRNIRGHDISEHTEPIDCLWPLATPAATTEAAFKEWTAQHKITPEMTCAMRRIAGISETVLTLGIGDGGNEVGMAKVVQLPGCAELRPDPSTTNPEFVGLTINGTYRTCDHVIVSTVSNWGGTAFEMAADVMCEVDVDYLSLLSKSGKTIADLEDKMLQAIMATPQPMSVDGVYNDRAHSVDGMNFNPDHADLYNMLWQHTGR